MIDLESASKKFGSLQALDNLSIRFDAGKSYAFIGPNGSGKTTMIKSILGMVIPSEGEIRVDGKSIRNDWKYREKIGYMPQIGHYPENMRIGQLMDMMRNIRQVSVRVKSGVEATLRSCSSSVVAPAREAALRLELSF